MFLVLIVFYWMRLGSRQSASFSPFPNMSSVHSIWPKWFDIDLLGTSITGVLQ